MNKLSDNRTRGADRTRRLARFSTLNTEEELWQKTDGGFLLRISETYFQGRRLGPLEGWRELGIKHLPDDRLHTGIRVLPLTKRQALEWCVRTQIPETFRGYLLESI
ncbi:MAG: hypothetical protein KGS61_20515 [Verrucomicrobia bacterium]|nr:hypothetical protein [Verrucomicrobiota bacterium]